MTSESLYQMRCLEFSATVIRQESFSLKQHLKLLVFVFIAFFFE